MKIIYGSNSKNLATMIANCLCLELLESNITKFSDGELKIHVDGDIPKEVILVQSTSFPVNDALMELLLLSDTAKRAGAQRITAVIPYFGYSRQDKCNYKNGPISARLVIKMLQAAGIDEVITIDLHSAQLEGFFDIPVKNISTEKLFLDVIDNNENIMIVSPDIGGIRRARNYANILGSDLAIINKNRNANNECSLHGIIGNVKDKKCIVIDDIIDGGTTLCLATELLFNEGAKKIDAIVTHGVLSGNTMEKIEKSKLNRLYISDSITHSKYLGKITVIPIYKLIADILKY